MREKCIDISYISCIKVELDGCCCVVCIHRYGNEWSLSLHIHSFIYFFPFSFVNIVASIGLTLKWISDGVLLKHIICGNTISHKGNRIYFLHLFVCLCFFSCYFVYHLFFLSLSYAICSMNLKFIVHVHWISLHIIFARKCFIWIWK